LIAGLAMDLDRLIKLIEDIGREIIYMENLEREYEITRIAHGENRFIVFSLKGIDITCYTNLYTSRNDLYRVLGANSDVEAYRKLNDALNNPAQLSIEDFDKYFVKTDLTLEQIPFIKYFREDGGYYLTSSIISACIDDVCNASFHRMMYIDQTRAGVRIVPRHLYHIFNEYRARGMDTPVAVLLGVNPLIEIASASSPPYGVYEIAVAARLTSDNRVVKTPLYKIPVPVDASIVIEGALSRDELVDEGPFVDILGLPDIVRKQPVFRMEAVYVNKLCKPVYHAIIPSFLDHVLLMGFPREAYVYNRVRESFPNVKSVRLSLGGSGWLHAIVSLKQSKPGEARLVALSVIEAHPSVKHVIVVDDDIDVDDPYMVEWAIATRVKGGEDIVVLRDILGSTLDPRSVDGVGDKVIIDATKPFHEKWDKYRRVNIP